MKSEERGSMRVGAKASVAAVMGIVIGLIAGVSLSHSTVPAQATLKTTSLASAVSSPQGGCDADASNDVCDIQLD